MSWRLSFNKIQQDVVTLHLVVVQFWLTALLSQTLGVCVGGGGTSVQTDLWTV